MTKYYFTAPRFVNPDKIQNARSRLNDYSSNYSVLAIDLTFHRVSVMCVGKHDLILPAGILGGLLLVHVCFPKAQTFVLHVRIIQLKLIGIFSFFNKNMFQCLLFEKGYIELSFTHIITPLLDNANPYLEYSISTVNLF